MTVSVTIGVGNDDDAEIATTDDDDHYTHVRYGREIAFVIWDVAKARQLGQALLSMADKRERLDELVERG